MAKFAANINNFTSTKLSLFFVLKDLHPCMSFDVINFLDIIICEQINQKKAIDILKSMQSI